MRIYITGIAGMLGSALAFVHQKRGDEVFGCDASIAPTEFHRLDIRNLAPLTDSMRDTKPDHVYHCAAMLGVQNTEENPEICRQINEFGTQVVMRAAADAGVKSLMFLSSSEVYGNGYDFKPFAENSPLLGSNVYAVGKRTAENIAFGYMDRMKVTVARMFNCFGVGQVAQFFIPKAILLCKENRTVPIFGSAGNRRSYLFGHDAATHLSNVADTLPSGEIVNVGHTTPYTLGETFSLIKGLTHSHSNMSVRSDTEDNYDDRSVKRDIPNRLGVFSKLRSYSDHTPMELPVALDFMVRTSHTLRQEWDYRRSLL